MGGNHLKKILKSFVVTLTILFLLSPICFCADNVDLKEQVKKGRQAYIVCPLVEENEDIDAKSVLELFEKYKEEVFSEFFIPIY